MTQGVEAALAELRPGMVGIDIDTTIYRPASFIERATGNLSTAVIIAAVLALVALVALLGSWRATLVAAASITTSLAAACLVFYLRGVDFNMMVVAGLLVAIAVVVDDAIVDAENIRRRLREASDGTVRPVWRIIANASIEIRVPMLYATLIIVIAVAPLLLMKGLSAAFFEPLAWSYIIAAVVSLVVATDGRACSVHVAFGARTRGGARRVRFRGWSPAPVWPAGRLGDALAEFRLGSRGGGSAGLRPGLVAAGTLAGPLLQGDRRFRRVAGSAWHLPAGDGSHRCGADPRSPRDTRGSRRSRANRTRAVVA